MKEPIYNINGDFDERYNDPTEEDYEDFDDYTWNTQREVDCGFCSGTGEGHASNSGCSWCGGKGCIIKKN